jgi:AraC family transcriptional activator of pobA
MGRNQKNELPDYDRFDEIDAPVMLFELDRDLAERVSQSDSMPHRHAYHEIIWLREGAAEHLLDGDRLQLPAPTLLIVPKGRIHRFHPSAECRGMVMRFTEEFLFAPAPELFSQIVGHRALQLNNAQASLMASYFELLRHEHEREDPYQLQALRYLLAAFIGRLKELFLFETRLAPLDFSDTLELWGRLNQLVEHHFTSEHRVSFYADKLKLSPRKLGRIARLYTGKHLSEIIDERLVTEAKRLLLYSGLSVKEIAVRLGFEEHSYFSRVFKKHTGKTPSGFRPEGPDA